MSGSNATERLGEGSDGGGNHGGSPGVQGSPAPQSASSADKRSRQKHLDGILILEHSPDDLVVKEGLTELVRVEKLPPHRVQRMKDVNIKPVEHLTFEDIRNYSRDQLRAYCYVYGVMRKKKLEMEIDMARYASYYHPNDPAYDPTKYTPKEKRAENDYELSPGDTPMQPSSALPPVHEDINADSKSDEIGSKRTAPDPLEELQARQNEIEEQKRRFAEMQRKAWEVEHEQLKQSAAKFKASFNGAGSLTAQMIDDAAAYFEGRETPEAIEDKAISWDRYHRNVGMLKEIFDTTKAIQPVDRSTGSSDKVKEMLGIGVECTIEEVEKAAGKKVEQLSEKYSKLTETEESKDRLFMKAFHRIEKASTMEQLNEVQKEFERDHNLKIVEVQPRIVQREVPPEYESTTQEKRAPLRLMTF